MSIDKESMVVQTKCGFGLARHWDEGKVDLFWGRTMHIRAILGIFALLAVLLAGQLSAVQLVDESAIDSHCGWKGMKDTSGDISRA